jgi:hypothetical protein
MPEITPVKIAVKTIFGENLNKNFNKLITVVSFFLQLLSCLLAQND